MTHVALTIAGSETTGGAGAQTDLKTCLLYTSPSPRDRG